MILSGKKIIEEQGTNLVINPFSIDQVNPNSYNLKLSNQLLVYCGDVLDMKVDNEYKMIEIPETGFLLEPDKLYLGRTMEYTETHKYIPMLEGRSSIGRLGICIHVTAGFGDIGFKGYWTLELFCIQPVRIYPYIEICQIYYHGIDGDYLPYTSTKYNRNSGIQPSKMYMELK